MIHPFLRMILLSVFSVLCAAPVLADVSEDVTNDTDWLKSTATLQYPAVVTQTFDKQKWQNSRASLDLKIRLRERWDLLRSFPVIGMSRGEITDLLGRPEQGPGDPSDIDYYALAQPVCNLNAPVYYLEFKYKNGRVSEFRTEHCRLPSQVANEKRLCENQRKILQEMIDSGVLPRRVQK